MDNKTLKGQLSKEQIQELKKTNPVIFEIVVDDAICYLRPPKRVEMSSTTALAQNDPLVFNELMLENCWLAGDECIKKNDEYFYGVSEVLAQIIEKKNAELKKI